ncbi:MAG: hypothetical protein ACFFDW_01365 [Candidatus Thorarchaeota archaeon]
MDGLESLWIINSNGLCLVHQVLNPNADLMNKSIFSSFLSALLTFSDSVFDDQLENIQMGKLDVHFKSFNNGKFLVAISTKRGLNIHFIQQKLLEVGEAFESEYIDSLEHQAICVDEYLPFNDTINKIFGISTIRIIPEHEEFLTLLKRAEDEQYTEDLAVEVILDFFEGLPQIKRKILLQSTLPILSIFTQSENLTLEQIKRFQEILTPNE